MMHEDIDEYLSQQTLESEYQMELESETEAELEAVGVSPEESMSRETEKILTPPVIVKTSKMRIFLLIYMFFLQGIPTGLSSSLPLILISNKASYSDLGTFSFMMWPMSLRILWAPIIDSVYFTRIGRRRTWIIPTTLLVGLIMFFTADYTQDTIYSGHVSSSEILYLTCIFFTVTFMASSQSVAVDGWTLTSLQNTENLAMLGICKKIGLTVGKHFSYQIFLILESTEISNSLRSRLTLTECNTGILPVGKFLKITGVLHILTSILFFVYLTEKKETKKLRMTVWSTYKKVWKILSLKRMKQLLLVIVTYSLAFGVEDLYNLKLVNKGVPREYLALITLAFFPVLTTISIIVNKKVKSSNSLILTYNTFPAKLIVLIVMCVWAEILTPLFREENEHKFSSKFYLLAYLVYISLGIVNCINIVTISTFFSRIADVKVGGTYFSLLYTVYNIGVASSSTFTFKIVNFVTFSIPSNSTLFQSDLVKSFVDSVARVQDEESMSGDGYIQIDGYIVLTLLYTLLGLVWMLLFRKSIVRLQHADKSEWLVT